MAGLHRPAGVVTAACGLALTAGLWGYLSRADGLRQVVTEPPPGYRATVYHVSDCPQQPIGDRFVGLDNLIALLGADGIKLFKSSTESLVAGPDGIVAANDVVIIKINYQWDERGGSNVDVLRGLIHRLVDHPDGFTGEIVVCENAQFRSVENFDRALNNAEDHSLSPHDVVLEFQGRGHRISHYNWTAIRYTSVSEYSAGDMVDGYIVYPYDALLHGRVSYPKFQTDYGTFISLRYGIWSPGSGTYDASHLRFINLPVLKSHHSTYGVTACIKDYMGVVTGELATSSHSAIRYGILGALLGEIRPADLNLLDCIHINANPYSGPATSYAGATRRNELVASTDPVAADIWSVKNILIPAFIEAGYLPPWPNPSADPDNPSSAFRVYLDNSMNRLLAAGYEVTNDLGAIDVVTWSGAGDVDGDSDVDLADYTTMSTCLTGPGITAPTECQRADFDADADVDLADFAALQIVFTGPGPF